MSLILKALKKARGDPSVRAPLGRASYGRGWAGQSGRPWRLLITAVAVVALVFFTMRLPGTLLGREPVTERSPLTPPTRPIQSEAASPIASPDVASTSAKGVAASPRRIGPAVESARKLPPPTPLGVVDTPRPKPTGPEIQAEAMVKPSFDTERPGAGRIEGQPHPPLQKENEKSPAVNPVMEGKDRYYFNMGLFYQEQQEYRRAFEAYQELVRLNPFHAEAYNNLGVLYKEIGDLGKAVEHYRKALAIDPKYVKAYNNLGVALITQGKLEQAVAQFERALLLNPKNLESYTNLGVIYRRQQRIPEALRAFESALSIDADHAETHYNLALLMEAKGRITKAVHHYRRFLASAGSDHGSAVSSAIARIRHLTRRTRSTAPPDSLRP